MYYLDLSTQFIDFFYGQTPSYFSYNTNIHEILYLLFKCNQIASIFLLHTTY